jgi:Protein of unknown function (DUF2917)
MNIATPSNKIQLVLREHQIVSLRGAKPRVSVDCKKGVLWITNSTDPRDHIVGARQHFSPQRQGNVLIEAMRDASVDIEES